MKLITDAQLGERLRQHSSLLEMVLSVIGVTASFFFLYRLYAYFAVDGVHPINIIYYYLGAAPITGLNFPYFAEISILDIIPLVISVSSTMVLYLGMAGLSALPAFKLIFAYAR